MNQPVKPSCLSQALLMGGAIATVATNTLLLATPPSGAQETLEDSPKVVIDEVWQLVNTEYVNKDFNHVDWQQKRQELMSGHYDNRKQAYKAIRQALKDLGDPYTRFLEPEEFAALTSQTSGEVSGVGIRIAIDRRTSQLYVVESLRNSPAMKANVKAGDRLIRIDGKPTALMNLEQAMEAIQGEIGTQVNLQLSNKDKGVYNVTLMRSQIEIPSVTYNLKQEGQLKIGYIKLDEFSSHAAEQMESAIEDLQKQQAEGFVLDLRGNPGGLLFASVDIARQWLKTGEIVSTIDRRGGDRHFNANGTSLSDLPLVVLVNEGSASASEILAGALKENKRATLVGTNTYGKGTVQSVHSLSDGSGLAVTIARYYPPSGTDINHKGIAPDIVLDLTMEQQLRLKNDPSLLATGQDPQYKRAITVLQSHQSPFSTPQLPKPVGIRWQPLN